MRSDPGPRIAAAVRAVFAGLTVIDPAVGPPAGLLSPTRSGTVPPPPRRTPGSADTLSAREAEVLQGLADGLSNKEIAARLYISDHTVKFHVVAILQKLGAASRTEAVVLAASAGWLML
jgi:DNA-binding NarL/FixJ family response regulator